jgi:hypothetical protein
MPVAAITEPDADNDGFGESPRALLLDGILF